MKVLGGLCLENLVKDDEYLELQFVVGGGVVALADKEKPGVAQLADHGLHVDDLPVLHAHRLRYGAAGQG